MKLLVQGRHQEASCSLGSYKACMQRLWKRLGVRSVASLVVVAAGLLALALLVLLPALAARHPWTGASCLETATRMEHSIAFVRQLQYRSRPLPDTAEGSPRLAASSWPGGSANRAHADSTRPQYQAACGGVMFRYRVVDRVIYTDHNHTADPTMKYYRKAFLEMLVTSVWLYQSFPDVTLWVYYGDEPGACSLNIPVLAYTAIDPAAVKLRADGTPTMPLFLPHLLTSMPDSASSYQKGFVIPYPHSWEQLSLSNEQLAVYSSCVAQRAKAAGMIPEVIWRGSNTGGSKGWRKAVPDGLLQLPAQVHNWGRALMNKRILACLMALDYEWLDVALHDLNPQLLGISTRLSITKLRIMASLGFSEKHNLYLALHDLVVRESVPIEQWARRPLSLSIDGHGAPWRLPQQLLSGTSAVLKMQSPYLEWFADSFKAGTHWEEFSYDLSDMVSKSRQLLDGYEAGSQQLPHMAEAAQKQAVRSFGMLQQLDALVWAVLQVKAACPWEVEKPVVGQDGWEVVQLPATVKEGWSSPGFPVHVRRQIIRQQHVNFVAQEDEP